MIKKHGLLGIILLCVMFLTSCMHSATYYKNQANRNLLRETWMQRMNTDPNKWAMKADSWFINGAPNRLEMHDQHAPIAKAETTMMVKVPNFTKVQIEGKFLVQIMGSQEHNTLFILGPNAQAREVAVELKGDTLCIHQAKGSKVALKEVIVRIGVRNLKKLTGNGPCLIEGRDVFSDGLIVNATDGGCIMLNGTINLCEVNQTGSGTVTIMGAYTPTLNIFVKGNGSVNVSGRVGIHKIKHAGNGQVNIIGADSNDLTIDASGYGKTSIIGYVNLKKVAACDGSCVQVYWDVGTSTYVYGYDKAQISVAGTICNLNVELKGSSRFYGQYLHGGNVFVKTTDWAHANVTADKKLFAAGDDSSSIYFFGSPNIVARYSTGSATVIPVWNDNPIADPVLPPPAACAAPACVKTYSYKNEVPSYRRYKE